jgi:hypothetical protein
LNKPIKVVIEAATANNQPLLSFIASSKGDVDFGKERVGSKHDSTLPTLYANLGHGMLHATKTEIVGPDRFDFQILEGTAPFDLDTAQRMPARLRFAPTSNGPKRAWLRVESNSKNSKADSIPLKGDGTAGPRLVLKVNDLAVDYRDRERGKLYDTTFNQFFYNDGTDTMTLYAEIEGPDKDDFTFGSFGIAELAPEQSLDLTITFFVKATEADGQRQADLVITTYYKDEPIDTDRVSLLGRVGPPASVPWVAQRNAGISITPNPTAGDADLHVVPMPDEIGLKYTMRVTDAAGGEVDLRKGTFSSEGISYRFRSGDLASGVYYISVATLRGTRVGSMTIAR